MIRRFLLHLLPLELLARALPMHRYDDQSINGHEGCLQQARAIRSNLGRA